MAIQPGEIGTQTVKVDAGVTAYKVNVTVENVDTIHYVVDVKLSTEPLVVATPQHISVAGNVVGLTVALASNPSGTTVTAEVFVLGW
jgi:hypothetical protein